MFFGTTQKLMRGEKSAYDDRFQSIYFITSMTSNFYYLRLRIVIFVTGYFGILIVMTSLLRLT